MLAFHTFCPLHPLLCILLILVCGCTAYRDYALDDDGKSNEDIDQQQYNDPAGRFFQWIYSKIMGELENYHGKFTTFIAFSRS